VLTFTFYVHKERFDHYADQVASGAVRGLILRVGRVEGFYADWSPSITTDKIRILTAHERHAVESLKGEFSLPRLGEVKEAELYFANEIKLPQPKPTENPEYDDGEPLLARIASTEAARDAHAQETVKLLRSMRIAAWAIAALLLVKLFV
jgi:hypothetical protein